VFLGLVGVRIHLIMHRKSIMNPMASAIMFRVIIPAWFSILSSTSRLIPNVLRPINIAIMCFSVSFIAAHNIRRSMSVDSVNASMK